MPNTTEELLLRISGDSQGGQQAIQQIVGSMDGLKGKSEELAGLLQKAFTDPGAAIEGLSTSISDVLAPSLVSVEALVAGLAAGFVAVGVAAFELAEHTAGIGGHLQDLADKTGIAVPELSQLSNALQVAGGDMTTVANAIVMMQKNMAEDGDKFNEGLRRINVSVDALRAMTPDQQFRTLAAAIAETTDPSQRAAAAMEIFGRQGRELLPVMDKLDEALKLTSSITPWSAEQAHQAEEFEMQTKALKLQFDEVVVTLGREVLPTVSSIVGWFAEGARSGRSFGDALRDSLIPGWQEFSTWLGRGALAAETAGAKQDVINRAVEQGAPKTIQYADAVKYLTEKYEALHPHQDTATTAADKWLAKLTENATKAMQTAAAQDALTESLANLGIVQGDVTDFGAQVEKDWQKRHDAAEKYDQALRNLTDVEGGYKTLLEQLGDDTVQAIFYELQHKGAIEDIATVYGVTTTQVRILADEQRTHEKEQTDALTLFSQLHEQTFKLAQQHEKDWRKEQDDALKAANKAVVDMTLATAANWNSYYDDVEKRSLSAKDYQVLKVSEWKDAQLAKFDPARGDWANYYASVEALSQQKLQEIEEKHNVLFQDIKGFLTDMTGADGQSGWGKHFFDVLAAGDGFKKGMLAIWDGGEDSIRGRVIKILEQMAIDFVNVYISKAAAALTGWLASLGGHGGLLGFLAGLIPGHGGDNGSSTPITGGHFDGDGNWVPDPAGGGGSGGGEPHPGGPGGPGHENPEPHESMGGIIPQYFRRGGFPGYPIGTDTVPTWLTPGEGVLNTRAMARLGTENFERLNAGARPGDLAGGGPRVVQNFYIDGNVWALQDLSRAVAQQLADDFMQVGGGMPLDH
jgi:hypothetical protein